MTVGKFYPHKPAPLNIISQNKHSCCCWSYQGGMLSMCEVSEYWVVSPETKSSRSYDRLTTKCGNCTEPACTEVTYCTGVYLYTEVTYCTKSSCTQRVPIDHFSVGTCCIETTARVQRVTCQLQPPTISQCAERNSMMGLLLTFLQGAECSENHQPK